MANGLPMQQKQHALSDPDFWEELALRLLHPTQLLVIEAIWHIEEPLSATLLQEIYEDQVSLGLFSYHCRRLKGLKVLRQVGEVPVRGVSEKLFEFTSKAKWKRA